MKTGLCILFVMIASMLLHGRGDYSLRHESILADKPLGYWPLDRNYSGNRALDMTDNRNHAELFNLRWIGEYLDFQGYNQWIQIESDKRYDQQTFSVCLWFYSREKYDKKGVQLWGNAYRHSGHRLSTVYEDLPERPWDAPTKGLSIFMPENRLSLKFNTVEDAIGLKDKQVELELNQWNHLAVCYDKGLVDIYLNGEKVASQENVEHSWSEMPIILGIQAESAPVNQWWNISLNGSFKDITFYGSRITEQLLQKHMHWKPRIAPATEQATGLAIKEDPLPIPENEIITVLKNGSETSILQALRQVNTGTPELEQTIIPILDGLLQKENSKRPYPLDSTMRSDETLRNAVINALLEISEIKNPKVTSLLNQYYFKPFFTYVDWDDARLKGVLSHYEKGEYQEAYESWKNLPLHEEIHEKDLGTLGYKGMVNMKGDRIYKPIAHYNGNTYVAGLEWVTPTEIAKLPEAKSWEEADKEWFGRLIITEIKPDGSRNAFYLMDEKFIFSAYDAKMHGWALEVDPDGYFHLVGGMHNIAMPERYLPGSFEKINASTQFDDENFPNVMYWVSKRPGDISEFEFVGQRNNPRTLPVYQGINYMPFVKDRNGVLFTYGRQYVQGMQCIGAYRYDHKKRTWKALGDNAPDMKTLDPVWSDHQIMTADVGVIRSMRLSGDHPQTKVLFWDKGTSWYGYSRGNIRFDKNNRMHLSFPLRGLDSEGKKMESYVLYAYSDDGGDTFYKANGERIASLPMSAQSGPQQADIIGEGGSSVSFFNAQGMPAVLVAGKGYYYYHFGKAKWEREKAPMGGLINVFVDNIGIISFRSESGDQIYRMSNFTEKGKMHKTTLIPSDKKRSYTNNIDIRELYDTGKWFSVQAKYTDMDYAPVMTEINFQLAK